MAKLYRCDECGELAAPEPEEIEMENGRIELVTLCTPCFNWGDRHYEIGYAHACGYTD